MYEIPTDPYNEVYPGVIIGDGTTALCIMKLKSMGITHVLNAAYGKDASFGLINTSASFYAASGIKFLGIEAYDMQCFDMSPFFNQAADFIDEALASGGKCYVHCRMGKSMFHFLFQSKVLLIGTQLSRGNPRSKAIFECSLCN